MRWQKLGGEHSSSLTSSMALELDLNMITKTWKGCLTSLDLLQPGLTETTMHRLVFYSAYSGVFNIILLRWRTKESYKSFASFSNSFLRTQTRIPKPILNQPFQSLTIAYSKVSTQLIKNFPKISTPVQLNPFHSIANNSGKRLLTLVNMYIYFIY